MNHAEELLARQAAWQKSRILLPWPEKIRLAEQMRASIEALRRGRPPSAPALHGGQGQDDPRPK